MSDTVKVEITYSPDPAKVGTTVEVPRQQARQMIREGRAKAVGKDAEALGRQARPTAVDPYNDKEQLGFGETVNPSGYVPAKADTTGGDGAKAAKPK